MTIREYFNGKRNKAVTFEEWQAVRTEEKAVLEMYKTNECELLAWAIDNDVNLKTKDNYFDKLVIEIWAYNVTKKFDR